VTRAPHSPPKTGSTPVIAVEFGLLIPATPLLLPRHEHVPQQERPSRSPIAQGPLKPGEPTP